MVLGFAPQAALGRPFGARCPHCTLPAALAERGGAYEVIKGV